VSSKDIHDRQNSSRVSSPRRWSRRSARFQWPWALEVEHGPTLAGGVPFFVYVVFSVFFKVVRWRLHLKARIRFSPPYPHFCDVSSVDRGRVEMCVRWFGFKSNSSNLWLPPLLMVGAFVPLEL
jgi:hypothetical protein